MIRRISFVGLSAALCAVGCTSSNATIEPAPPSSSLEGRGPVPKGAPELAVTSDAFSESGLIPQSHAYQGFGCTGDNQSPPISWGNVPEGTQSYAIIVHDPDAPTGGTGFFHWVVYDIPASANGLATGEVPAGAKLGLSDFGTGEYGGPCPPPGETHRYRFTVYALDVPALGVEGTPSAAMTRFAMTGHVLAVGTLTGTYRRR